MGIFSRLAAFPKPGIRQLPYSPFGGRARNMRFNPYQQRMPFMGGGFNPYQQRMPFMGGGFNPYQQRMPFMGGGFNPYQQRMPFMGGGFNPYQPQPGPQAPPSINDLFSGLDEDARADFFKRFGLATRPPEDARVPPPAMHPYEEKEGIFKNMPPAAPPPVMQPMPVAPPPTLRPAPPPPVMQPTPVVGAPIDWRPPPYVPSESGQSYTDVVARGGGGINPVVGTNPDGTPIRLFDRPAELDLIAVPPGGRGQPGAGPVRHTEPVPRSGLPSRRGMPQPTPSPVRSPIPMPQLEHFAHAAALPPTPSIKSPIPMPQWMPIIEEMRDVPPVAPPQLLEMPRIPGKPRPIFVPPNKQIGRPPLDVGGPVPLPPTPGRRPAGPQIMPRPVMQPPRVAAPPPRRRGPRNRGMM